MGAPPQHEVPAAEPARESDQQLSDHPLDQAVIAHLEAQVQADRDKIAHLEIALASARRIGTAIGILMAQRRITDADAFETLRAVSQYRQRKLRDIAEDVILTGTLPEH